MLIDHHDQQIVRRRTQNLELCLGPTWGPTKQKLRKPRLLEQFCSDQPTARRETHWLARRQNVEGPAAARARSRAACRGGERARRSESTYAQLVDMMSRIVAHNRLRDGSLENATCARGTNQAKLDAWRGKSRSI